MSVNLSISFEIHNIRKIHRKKNVAKRDELYKAANKFLEEHGILDQGMIVDFKGENGFLVAYTTFPLIISRSYLWIPDITKKWEALAISILGSSCKPSVIVDYSDEEI